MCSLIVGGGRVILTSGMKFAQLATDSGNGLRLKVLRPHGLVVSKRGIRGRDSRRADREGDLSLLQDLEKEAARLQTGSATGLQQTVRQPNEIQDYSRTAETSEQGHGHLPAKQVFRTASEKQLDPKAPYRLSVDDEVLFAERETYVDLVKRLKNGLSFTEVTVENQHECIRRVMCPFLSESYEEELRLKRKKNEELVLRLHRDVLGGGNDARARKGMGTTLCHPALGSPQRLGYRRKDEFSVNVGADGNGRTVGFYVGSPRKGLVCVPPEAVDVISPEHKKVAAAFQRFLRHHTALEPFLITPQGGNNGGHWRSITVRSDSAGGIMASVSLHPQRLDPDQLEELKEALAHFFSPRGPGADACVSTLYLQPTAVSTRLTGAPQHLLFGPPHLEENFLGRRFCIGPESFFHSNVNNLEVLVSLVRERLDLRSSSTLLDLCCGVGLFGVLFSPAVRRVHCTDINPVAVREAVHNAELNGVRNAEFSSGRLEDCLGDILSEEADQARRPGGGQKSGGGVNYSVVLNPGRSGVNFQVIAALRARREVSRLVYVSCQPEGNAFKNLRDLCKTQKKGIWSSTRPFRLKEAVPVDMFPGTHCCEHVFVFER